jgi:hypothetical protein
VRWTVRRRRRHAKDGEEEEARERETKVRRSKQKKIGCRLARPRHASKSQSNNGKVCDGLRYIYINERGTCH